MLVNYTFVRYKDTFLLSNLDLITPLSYTLKRSLDGISYQFVISGSVAVNTLNCLIPIIADGDYQLILTNGTDSSTLNIYYYLQLQKGLIYNIKESICNKVDTCIDCPSRGLDDCVNYQSLFSQLTSYQYFIKPYSTDFCDQDCLIRSYLKEAFDLNRVNISQELYGQLADNLYTGRMRNGRNLTNFIAAVYYLVFYFYESSMAADQSEQDYIDMKFYWIYTQKCISSVGISTSEMKVLFDTINPVCNEAPTVQSTGKTFGNLTINQLQTYQFLRSDFTTGFADPNGDNPGTVKILQNTFKGQLFFNGTLINGDGFTFPIAQVGNLQYKFTVTASDAKFDKIFFQISDDNPSPKFSNMATFAIAVTPHTNQPPDEVGNNSIVLSNRVTRTFTLADFTSGTTPPYHDPEGDGVYQLRVDTLPALGSLLLNGVAVTAGQIINASAINAAQFTYVSPNQDTTANVSFNFSLSDTGSHIFVS